MVSQDWIFQTKTLSKLVRRSKMLHRLATAGYEESFTSGRNRGIFRGVFDTFEQAARSAPSGDVVGYDNPDAGAMYRDRLGRVYPSDYPVLFWLQSTLAEVNSVFDFGGHVGIARYAYERYLRFSDRLTWQVCDVPAVVESGRRLAQERGAQGLIFTTNERDAADVDLFFSAGALQYLDWTLPSLLSNIKPPKRLLLNLLPISDRPTYFTLQNIGTAYCPYRILNRDELFGGLERIGYRVVDQWTNPDKSCNIPLFVDHSLSSYEGAYLTLDR